MWQETWGSSRAATGTSGTHSETQVSLQVARGLSGILFSWCRGIGPHLQLRPEPQFPSPVLTWISGILWMFNRGVRPRFVWRNGTLRPSSGSLLFSLERGLGIALQAMQEMKALTSRGRGCLRGFLKLLGTWGFSHEARQGSQGASLVWPGKSGLHARG